MFIDEINKPIIDKNKAEFYITSSILIYAIGIYSRCLRVAYKGKILAKVRSGLLTVTLEKQLDLTLQ